MIARNADPGSTLPYLLRIALGDGIILKAKDTWPSTATVSRSGQQTPRFSAGPLWRLGGCRSVSARCVTDELPSRPQPDESC